VSSDDLVCAACGGRVAEGRCPTCRASRELLRRGDPLPVGPFLLAALLCLVLLVLLTA
jgi:hypothetical protein